MAVLFFVLDLENLPLSLFNQIKQCLLELANSYAALRRSGSNAVLRNRIGVYYLQRTQPSLSLERLKELYPLDRRSFGLHDFHQAVERLPEDLYCPKIDHCGPSLFQDAVWSRVLSEDVGEDAKKKVVVISTSPPGDVDSSSRKNLLEAADKCVHMEFIFFEQMADHLNDVSSSVEKFKGAISDLCNCLFFELYPEKQVFQGLVKRWLQELKNNSQELLQARLIFESSMIGCIDIFLSLTCVSFEQMINGINDKVEQTTMVEPETPVMNQLEQVSFSIDLNIVERTNMSSLSEGYVVGAPFVVIPSSCHKMNVAPGQSGKLQLNDHLFQGLCEALHSFDQGLICWSFCNIDLLKMSEFHYYYILQPSDSGLMLLRRLATAEEVLPFPILHLSNSSTVEGTENSVRQSLLEIDLKDYNPLLHDGGFHQKLNLLMKNLPFGVLPAKDNTAASISCPLDQNLMSKSVIDLTTASPHTHKNGPKLPSELAIDLEAVQKGTLCMDLPTAETCFTRDWDNLIVDNISLITSQPSAPKSSAEKSRAAPFINCRPRDTKTSHIMERLEPPRQTKPRVQTTVIRSEVAPNTLGSVDSSHLMRPIFSMLKRKKK